MTNVCPESTGIAVTVRYFAAARAAAGVDSETLTMPPGGTVADLIGSLSARDARLATVLRRCSYLCDGIAVRGPATPLPPGGTLDVLPPFAGG